MSDERAEDVVESVDVEMLQLHVIYLSNMIELFGMTLFDTMPAHMQWQFNDDRRQIGERYEAERRKVVANRDADS